MNKHIQTPQSRDDIALVGMSCRFPQAPNINAFWTLLSEGGDGISALPAERWDGQHFYGKDPKEAGKTHCLEAGYIKDIDHFDAAFFGISPREAVQMDPQQRLLLEVAQEALDNAGLASSQLAGSNSGVYIGAMSNDYLLHQLDDNYRQIDVHTGGGAGHSMLANRLSYYFDWHGPSVSLDSACSSSLVAVYQACQQLWLGDSDLALAGGVNLMLDPSFSIFYSKAGLLAPDGRCKTFAAGANGIGRGEGVGLVVLKRLADAKRDGDRIYACIHSGAVNHGGRSNGVTAPNRWAQEQLMEQVLGRAGNAIDHLGYVELHGTGTYIGDPIEAKALGAALHKVGRQQPVWVGSVKTNIGHLEGAAGIAGLIKLALCLHHRTLVPNLHFNEPSPAIDFTQLPLRVNTQSQPWPAGPNGNCLGAINSFGLGGTNAQLLLQSAPTAAVERVNEAPFWLSLSAQTQTGLMQLAESWRQHLGEPSSSAEDAHSFAELARASLIRRNHYPQLLQIFAQDRQQAITALDAFIAGEPSHYWTGRSQYLRGSLAIVYHSSLWHGPVAASLSTLPLAQAAWQQCQQALAGKVAIPALHANVALVDPLYKASALYALMVQLRAIFPLKLHINWQLPVGSEALVAIVTTPAGATQSADLALALSEMARSFALDDDTNTEVLEPDGLTLWLTHINKLDNDRVISLWPTEDKTLRACLAQLARIMPIGYNAWLSSRAQELPSYPWQHQRYWLARLFPHQRAGSPSIPAASIASIDATSEPFETPKVRDPLTVLNSTRAVLAKALRWEPDQLDPYQPLTSLGIDSLTAVEVKNQLERQWQVTIPLVKLLDGFSLDDLAGFISAADINTVADTQQPAADITHKATAPQPALQEDEFDHQVAAMNQTQIEEMLNWFDQQEAA